MKKILVVEDDKYLSNAYMAKLTRIGFEARLAGDGDEALSMLNDYTPDLILLDLIMPRKDGFSTLKELKANPKWKDIPIIITSNLDQQEDIDKGMRMGAMDYVIKTEMQVDDFLKKIKMILHV